MKDTIYEVVYPGGRSGVTKVGKVFSHKVAATAFAKRVAKNGKGATVRTVRSTTNGKVAHGPVVLRIPRKAR